MQISGVSLTPTWPCRLCLLRVLLGRTATVTSFPPSKYTGGGGATPALSGWHVYSSRGKCPFHISCGVFLPLPLLQVFPLLVVGRVPLLLPSLTSLFIYSSMRDCPSPSLGAQGALPSLLRVFLVFSSCLFIIQFVFYPWWESVCPGSYAGLAQGCLWEYRVPLSSPGGLLLPSKLGAGVWWHESCPGFSI
jgi:hypothetical protein